MARPAVVHDRLVGQPDEAHGGTDAADSLLAVVDDHVAVHRDRLTRVLDLDARAVRILNSVCVKRDVASVEIYPLRAARLLAGDPVPQDGSGPVLNGHRDGLDRHVLHALNEDYVVANRDGVGLSGLDAGDHVLERRAGDCHGSARLAVDTVAAAEERARVEIRRRRCLDVNPAEVVRMRVVEDVVSDGWRAVIHHDAVLIAPNGQVADLP